MSFQDFGKRPAAAAPRSGNSAATDGGLAQISESLLQYQRNVGILEKIVQSFSRSPRNAELSAQYRAQTDVLKLLEERVATQLKQCATTADETKVIKLKRDFERVRQRVTTLSESVEQLKRQQAKQAAAVETTSNSSSSNNAVTDQYERMRIQAEEDRLHEEIMREREEEIRNINRGMHQVNEIYKDLATIVSSQQEQIDNIETQMEDSKVNAEAGLKQVEKANEKYGNGQCVIS